MDFHTEGRNSVAAHARTGPKEKVRKINEKGGQKRLRQSCPADSARH